MLIRYTHCAPLRHTAKLALCVAFFPPQYQLVDVRLETMTCNYGGYTNISNYVLVV
jgi:hypothetical protein